MSQSIAIKTMALRNDSWHIDFKLLIPVMALISIVNL